MNAFENVANEALNTRNVVKSSNTNDKMPWVSYKIQDKCKKKKNLLRTFGKKPQNF